MASPGSPTDIYAETLAVFERDSVSGEPLTTPEVASELDCERRAAYERLKTLADRGELRTKEVGSGGRVWWRPTSESGGTTSSAGPDSESPHGRIEQWSEAADSHATRDALALLERAVDAFIVLDSKWRFVYVNEQAEAEFDTPADELLGSSIWEVVPEGRETPFYEHYHQTMAEGEPQTIEEYFEPWDVWYREHLYPSEGRLFITFRDITEQRERERELQETKAQLEAAIEAGAVGTWEWHVPEDRFVAGRAFAETFDVDPEDAREGVSLEQFVSAIHDDDIDRIEQAIETALEACGEYEEEYRVRDAEGTLRWVRARGHVQCDQEGNPTTFPGVLTDITERKRGEKKRQLTIDRMTDAVIELDEDWRFTVVNEQAQELFGMADGELLGESVWEVFPDLVETRIYELFHQVMATGEPTTLEEHFQETAQRFRIHVYPSLDGGLSVYFRDITGQREYERELKRHNAELAQLNQVNELFQELVQAAVTEPTRSEIEQTVCDQLLSADRYHGAWVGEQVRGDGAVVPRVWEGFAVDDIPERAAGDSSRDGSPGLATRALDTGEVHIRASSDPPPVEIPPDLVQGTDIDAVLAVPLIHEDVSYGVLVVYTAELVVFDDLLRDLFADLGDTIGFAIAAARRKAALTADSAVRLTLDIRDREQFVVDAATQLGTRVTLEGVARRGDWSYLVYISVADTPTGAVRDFATDRPERVRVVREHESGCLCEVTTTGSSLVSTVTEHGGTVTDLVAEAGHATVIVELLPAAVSDAVLDALRSTVDELELKAKRAVDRSVRPDNIRSAASERLTDSQWNVIRAAYLAGYFEHPRASTGEEVAESLDISSSTFHQHLQVGLGRLLAGVLEETDHTELDGTERGGWSGPD